MSLPYRNQVSLICRSFLRLTQGCQRLNLLIELHGPSSRQLPATDGPRSDPFRTRPRRNDRNVAKAVADWR